MDSITRAVLMGAGPLYGAPEIRPGDTVVAVDGGQAHARALGCAPHIVVGDFDSSDAPEGAKVVRLNPVKDETDMSAAAALAFDAGCREFHIYGGAGGRLDHTLANLQLIYRLAAKGARAYLYGDGEVMTALLDEEIGFTADARGTVSVFALYGDCPGVTERGLQYALHDAFISRDDSVGVSNAFTGAPSAITARGALLVVFPAEAMAHMIRGGENV